MSRRSLLVVAPVLALAVLVFVARLTGGGEGTGPETAPLVLEPEEIDAPAGGESLPSVQGSAPSLASATQRTVVPAALGASVESWSGRVEDALSGAPLPNAVVRLQRGEDAVEVSTGDAGEFTLGASAHPEVTLLVAHDAYVDLREANPDLSSGRVLRLHPSGSLRGVLRGPGAAAGEARVSLWSGGSRFDGDPLASATPDEELAFRFDDLAPGLYGIGIVDGPGPLVFQNGVLVEPQAEAFVTLQVPAGLGLQGRVVEGDARRPIAGARVSTQTEIQGIWDEVERRSNREVETDDGGRFSVAGLTEGGLEIDVRSPWGARRRLRANVSSLDPGAEVLVVFPEAARVAGIVRDSRGAPVTAIVGVLTDGDRDLRRGLIEDIREEGLALLDDTVHAWTGADGRFVFDRVPSNEELFLFALPDPEAAEPEGPASLRLDRLSPGQSREDIELALVAGQSVSGRVVDEDGAPIAGTRVELVRGLLSEWQTLDEFETDESGSFVLHGAVEGVGSVTAFHEDYDWKRVRLEEVSLDEPIELRLSAAPAVQGRLVDEDGRAVAGVGVRLRSQSNRRSSRSDWTDDFGRFRLERLDPDTYRVELRDSEWRLAAGDDQPLVEVPGTQELVLVAVRDPLELPVSVGGEVLDAETGDVVPNLRIDEARGGVVLIRGRRFDLKGMRPGEASLELEASGYETLRTDPRLYAPGSHVELGSFALWRAGELRVNVVGPEDEPLRGARVRLRALPLAEGGAGAERAPLSVPEARRRRGRGPAGRYARDDVPLRVYDLEVQLDGFRKHSERIELRGRRTELRVKLVREP